ncbi:MAG TPA: YetF domain-containing protein [Pyrinomonadaceae bacterium]|nr:YetF domain-containing protein [Pyrinomonadaceae bacterium]
MLQALGNQLQIVLGLELDVSGANAVQMALRTIVVYVFSLAIVRLGSKRFLSQASAFDFIVGIMLGSVMSRAINGSAPFFPTLVAGTVLIGMHWLLAVLAYHIDWFGPLVKGNPVLLVKEGQIQEQGMRRAGLSAQDLEEALRLQSDQTDASKIQLAHLERNGSVSVIPFKQDVRVLDVSVADGVQTVRIELG